MSTDYTYGTVSELELFCLPVDLQEFIRRHRAPQKEPKKNFFQKNERKLDERSPRGI